MKFLILFILIFIGFSTNNPKSFEQQLPGTDLSIGMLHVPSGTLDVKGKTHAVPAFYMSSMEISWELYNLYLNRDIDHVDHSDKINQVQMNVDGISGASFPYVDMSLGMGSEDNYPVCNVTPFSASQFCQWLSAITGRFYRLPTEEEWKYALQADSAGKYFWGNDDELIKEYAWLEGNTESTYHKTGTKAPNPWGFYDQYGNVAEWVISSIESDDSNVISYLLLGGSYQDNKEKILQGIEIKEEEDWKDRDPQFPKSKWWYTDAPFAGFRIVSPLTTPPPLAWNMYWGNPK